MAINPSALIRGVSGFLRRRTLTPRPVGYVTDAVHHQDQVAGRQRQQIPDAVQQAVELAQMEQAGDDKYRHNTDEIHDANRNLQTGLRAGRRGGVRRRRRA